MGRVCFVYDNNQQAISLSLPQPIIISIFLLPTDLFRRGRQLGGGLVASQGHPTTEIKHCFHKKSSSATNLATKTIAVVSKAITLHRYIC